jgi:glyoxylase-like metal-dependent hydrolase (beta-lactamase superfamily II)
MKISTHAAILRISDRDTFIFRPALLFDENEIILVDTGYLHQYNQLKAELTSHGFPVSSVTGLILTHQDSDHMAAARALRSDAPLLKVMAHEEDAPYIDGSRTPLKLAAMGTDFENFSEEKMMWYRRRKDCIEKGSTSVDRRLSGGDFLPCCGGIDIIHTPGHTPGHISLFVREDGILITGDAMHIREGELFGPMTKPANMTIPTMDVPTAVKSLEQFRNYPIQKVLCYHGGLFEGDFAAVLDEIMAGKQ